MERDHACAFCSAAPAIHGMERAQTVGVVAPPDRWEVCSVPAAADASAAPVLHKNCIRPPPVLS
ncbi:hypothetical protein FTO74_09340 [Granulicella sp. WH15]|uniref:hypothetical protein n=1 Tax=Granulicella sp. WH15 TaxID=2602070 RepID=UPI001366A8C5|nr:hypothetical protein [Granulicella sp. WH15]QHN03550.1 hypothetical protein FTO74_09340 [Granulicella sp. WH15]